MRALVIGCLALVAGCGTPCKDGTALATLQFDATTAAADQLVVSVAVDDGAPIVSTTPKPDGSSTGTLQIEFPSGYPSGHSVTLDVTAQRSGQPIGGGSATFALTSGCTALGLAVAAGAGPGDMSMSIVPTASIVATPDLVGFSTKLDGSGSSDPNGMALGYAWSFAQVPPGSTVTTASLDAPTAAKASFEPDLGGDYQVTLNVTTSDMRVGTKTITVTVPTAPVFHYRIDNTATTGQMGAGLVRSDGTGVRYLSCPFSQDGGINVASNPHQAGFALSVFAPAMGSAARAAFLAPVSLDGTMPPQLQVASDQTSCTSAPPVRVDANVFNDHTAMFARFSPDGTRLAYVDMPFSTSSSTYRLVTVAADGQGPTHVVRSNAQLGFPPPFWIDNATVGWVESNGSGGDVLKAPDQNGAGETSSSTRTVLLHCDPSMAGNLQTINQVAIGPFGLIVAGSTGGRGGAFNPVWNAMQLYRMQPGDCSTISNNTQVLDGEPYGGEAWDFELSADGLTVLYSSTHGMGLPDGGSPPPPQHDIYLVPSDGSSPPKLLVGDPVLDDLEPRFIAGGRQIVWTQAARPVGDADATALAGTLMVANADGTHQRRLHTDLAGLHNGSVDTGMNRAFECTGVPGRPAAGAGVALVALAALGLALGRRRRG